MILLVLVPVPSGTTLPGPVKTILLSLGHSQHLQVPNQKAACGHGAAPSSSERFGFDISGEKRIEKSSVGRDFHESPSATAYFRADQKLMRIC